jgi:hypothetical protein
MGPRYTPLSTQSILLLFIAVLASAGARADDLAWSRIQCVPAVTLDSQIRYCTDNQRAAAAAQTCSAQLRRAWADAAKEIAVLHQGPDSGQRLELGTSQEKYDTAVERLRILIDVTKRNADQLAQYPNAMVDSRDLESWSESLPCFRDVYDQVASTVKDLDVRANQGRAVLASASKLRSQVTALARNQHSASPARAVTAQVSAPAPLASPAAIRQPASVSDITGIRKEPDLN